MGAALPLPTIENESLEWPWISNEIGTFGSNSKWPRVSIIMPSLNQVDFLEQAIRSVLLQNYPNLEFIVIDGGSSDGSLEILKKYSPWFDYWVSEPDNGQSAAINKGFGMATGEIVGWLNSDDMYLPGCIFRIAETIMNNPDCGLIVGQVGVINAENQRIGVFEPIDYSLNKLLSFKQIFPQQAAFFARRIFENIGMLREDLHYAMDHEYFVRIAYSGIPIAFVKDELALFRVSRKNKGSAYRNKWAYEFEKIAYSILDNQKESNEIKKMRGSILGGAYYRGADAFYKDECFSATREWLHKAIKAKPSYLMKPGWWKRYLLSFFGKPGSKILFKFNRFLVSKKIITPQYDWDFSNQIVEYKNSNISSGNIE